MARAAARHILVSTEAQCNDLKKQIAGGADFAALAKQHSSCPSGRDGGALGTFSPGQMVKEFDAFNEGNDPWNEHDFGAFDFRGEMIFWKIDDHKGHEGYELVLTVMLASEY